MSAGDNVAVVSAIQGDTAIVAQLRRREARSASPQTFSTAAMTWLTSRRVMRDESGSDAV